MDCVYLFDRYFGFRCLAVLDLPGAVFLFTMGSSRGLEDGESVWGDAAGTLFEVS